MKTPNLIVAGFPKCGTTWLYNQFFVHPDIYVPPMKELHFFDRDYNKGIKYYGKYFNLAKNHKLIVDITPSYILHDEVAVRIKEKLGNINVLVILRNPTDLAISRYNMLLRNGSVNFNINKFDIQVKNFLEQTRLFNKVKLYKSLFPNLNIKLYDKLLENNFAFLSVLLADYGLDIDISINTNIHRKVNKRIDPRFPIFHKKVHSISQVIRNHLPFKYHFLLDGLKEKYKDLVNINKTNEIVEQKTIDQIKEFYEEDVLKLADLLNINLISKWNW